MTDLADDVLRLRRQADATVDLRWRTRGRVIAALAVAMVVLVPMAVGFAMTTDPWRWIVSHERFASGEIPGDHRDTRALADTVHAEVRGWTLTRSHADEYLVVELELESIAAAAPYAILARWSSPRVVPATTEAAYAHDTAPMHQVGAFAGVIRSDGNGVVEVATGQSCSTFANDAAAPLTYCAVSTAFALGTSGDEVPLPDSILLVDGSTGTPLADFVLERDEWRYGPCDLRACGSLSPRL